MIKNYIGNETYEIRLDSGKEVILSESEIKELCFELIEDLEEKIEYLDEEKTLLEIELAELKEINDGK